MALSTVKFRLCLVAFTLFLACVSVGLGAEGESLGSGVGADNGCVNGCEELKGKNVDEFAACAKKCGVNQKVTEICRQWCQVAEKHGAEQQRRCRQACEERLREQERGEDVEEYKRRDPEREREEQRRREHEREERRRRERESRSGGRKKTVNTSLTTMTSVDIITDHLKAYFLDYPLSMNVADQFVRKFVPNVYKPGQQKIKPNSKTGAGGTFVKVHDRREFLLNFKGSREQMLKRLKEAQLEEVERRNAKAAQSKSKARKAMSEEQRKKERQRQLLAEAGLGDFEDDEEEDFDEEDEENEELEANQDDGDDDVSDEGDDDEDYEDYEEDEDDDLIDQDDLEDEEIEGEWEVVHETQGNEDTEIHQKMKN